MRFNNFMLRRSFTLVELLATVAIIAVLSVIAGFFIVSYISWSQSVTDQRTLAVFNDALTRYKTEGGGTAALTASAPMSHIITALQTPINWNGLIHQVMLSSLVVNAHSLYASGSGSNYQFTAYNTYTNIPGGSSPRTVISFTNTGSTTWTVPTGVTSIEVLVVAGGGGGAGGGGTRTGGGGGAGGLIHQNSYTVAPGASLTVTVGAGGAAGVSSGTNGGNSVFDALTAIGGGTGSRLSPAGSGGSGGGSNGTGTVGQGNNGGAGDVNGPGYTGGGGGAGAIGGAGSNPGSKAGDGGVGLQFSTSGVATYYAGGGGGGTGNGSPGTGGAGGNGGGGAGTYSFSGNVATNGTANTGGGGGGCGPASTSASGGSGIVIVSY